MPVGHIQHDISQNLRRERARSVDLPIGVGPYRKAQLMSGREIQIASLVAEGHDLLESVIVRSGVATAFKTS
jgi:hypothetical protein